MASLHSVTDLTKRILVFLGIGFVILIVIIILFQAGQSIKETFFPSPPTPPDVSFGKLTPFSFPKSTVDSSGFTYTVNTLTGSLPQLPDRVTIDKIVQPLPSFQSFQNANDLLNKIGFVNNPTSISDTVYQWTKDTPFSTQITYNILTKNFTYTSNYLQDPIVLAGNQITDAQQAITVSQLFFDSFSSLPSDVDPTNAKTSFFAIQNGALSPVESLSNAQIIRVDFFQNSVNKLPIYYPQYPKSLINTLVGSGEQQPQVVQAQYVYQSPDTSETATYPIKTATEAFDELKKNQAYVANYDGTANAIVIRDVSLGYYIGESQQNYLIPVIVISGDNNFYAYVSAIEDQWFQTK